MICAGCCNGQATCRRQPPSKRCCHTLHAGKQTPLKPHSPSTLHYYVVHGETHTIASASIQPRPCSDDPVNEPDILLQRLVCSECCSATAGCQIGSAKMSATPSAGPSVSNQHPGSMSGVCSFMKEEGLAMCSCRGVDMPGWPSSCMPVGVLASATHCCSFSAPLAGHKTRSKQGKGREASHAPRLTPCAADWTAGLPGFDSQGCPSA